MWGIDMLRKVNKGYYRTAYIVFYDKDNDVLESEPQRFRYKNLRKGDYRSNQVIAGWLQTDASKVIETDSYVLYQRGIDKGKLRGDKYLENTDKEEVLTNQVKPELEMGAYDPIFGTKIAGTATDVRSVDFIEVVSGGEYKFNLVGISDTSGTMNVLQFDVNGDTTSTVDEITYNQALTLEEDTVKVKIWATDILLDSQDNIITNYALSLLKRKYKDIGEIVDFELVDDEDLELCAIRGRRDMSKVILRLS